jgi:hypothetical protein
MILQLGTDFFEQKKEELESGISVPQESIAAQFQAKERQYRETIHAASGEIARRDARIAELQRILREQDDRGKKMRALAQRFHRKLSGMETGFRSHSESGGGSSSSEPGELRDEFVTKSRKPSRPPLVQVSMNMEKRPKPKKPVEATKPKPAKKREKQLSEGELDSDLLTAPRRPARVVDDDDAGYVSDPDSDSGEVRKGHFAPKVEEEEEEEEEEEASEEGEF